MALQCSDTALQAAEAASSDNATSAGGYDPVFFNQLARIEDKHFWFCARNQLIYRLARRIALTLPPHSLVLEVGCGTGNVLRVLERACPNQVVAGLELWFDGLPYAKARSSAFLVQGDVRQLPFARPVAFLGMFDVLEHVPEDRETLAALRESLAPGGTLLLTVPAHQSLWSYFDEAAHHCRRYSVDELRGKLLEAGFRVDFVSQYMACIFPVVWAVRKLRRLPPKADATTVRGRASGEFRLVPIVNYLVKAALRLEASWVGGGYCVPFGTSLVVIARKA